MNKASAQRPEVVDFLEFYFANAPEIVEHPKVNYVALSEDLYTAAVRRLKDGITGSAIAQAGASGPVDLDRLYVGQ